MLKPENGSDSVPQVPEKNPGDELKRIRENTEMFKLKALRIREERERKEKQTEEEMKIKEREQLLAKLKETNDQLAEAEEISLTLQEVQMGGELKDNKELNQHIEATRKLVEHLEKQREKISADIAKIEIQGNALAKGPEGVGVNVAVDAAGLDLVSSQKEKPATTESLLELLKDARSLADRVEGCARTWNESYKKSSDAAKIMTDLRFAADDAINEVMPNLDRSKEKGQRVVEALNFLKGAAPKDLENALNGLEKIPDTLGMFAGKERAAIQSVLNKKATVFTPYIAAALDASQAEAELKSLYAEVTEKSLVHEHRRMKEKYKNPNPDYVNQVINAEVQKNPVTGIKDSRSIWGSVSAQG